MTKSKLTEEINVDTSSLITDHKYQPKDPKQPWGLCLHCNMAEAAHKEAVKPYKPAARRPKVNRAKRGRSSNGKPS